MQGTTQAHPNSDAPQGQGRFLPADARIVSHAVTPSEPYFPKVLIISGGAFAASLLSTILFTLLREWFSGSARRQAFRARPEPIDEVAIPQWMPFEPEEAMRLPPAPVDVPMPRPRSGTAKPARLGEIGIERAAEQLIAGGAARAIFVSPEGDEAAAVAVLVAREVAGAGLRVLLLDLTASGAASRPMLDTIVCAGITDLLASEAQFTDVIHQDHYSDCHVIPVGTAEPARAMRAADRLPIIMESLTTAYDLVVVECGPADAEGIRRLAAAGAEVLVSLIDADAEAAAAAERLKDAGCPCPTLVTPAGYQPPAARVHDRSAA
jgi:Mrp family chromosome partitioning ATPase